MAQQQASKKGLKALEYAELFVGVKEHPSGSNHGPDTFRNDKHGRKWKGGIDYWCYLANGIRGGYAWCAAFATGAFELTSGHRIGPPTRASVGFFEAWARQNGMLTARPYRGDIVCYRFDSDDWPDHMGIVQKVLQLPKSGRPLIIRTVEGNTSLGNNANGGQVQVRTRIASRCRFVRIPD